LGTTTTATKAPSCVGAFAVRETVGWAAASVGHFGTVVRGYAMAHTAAPIGGTGLPVGTALRLRPLGVMTDLAAEAVGTDVQLNNDSPGDLPPRDPLS